MSDIQDKYVVGPWVIHHGRKLAQVQEGAADFPVIDVAAKSATLLARIGTTNNTELTHPQVESIARYIGLNQYLELPEILRILEKKRLIESTDTGVAILGITSHVAVGHASEIYFDMSPSKKENAAILLSELTSDSPKRQSEIIEQIGDESKLKKQDLENFFQSAEYFGFIDNIELGGDKLYFNGNLFRKQNAEKTHKILKSLSREETDHMNEFVELLEKSGCIDYNQFKKILGHHLAEKLIAAGVFDLNRISNEYGEHIYVTSPSAFHKFIDPVVDDCFNMAKSLVSALTYGNQTRSPMKGRIRSIRVLLQALINGRTIGPATAIGNDYRILETNRVVEIIRSQDHPDRFFMKLLKIEVGELAMMVLSKQMIAESSETDLNSEPMTLYFGPEINRTGVRKEQSPESESRLNEVLESLRVE